MNIWRWLKAVCYCLRHDATPPGFKQWHQIDAKLRTMTNEQLEYIKRTGRLP